MKSKHLILILGLLLSVEGKPQKALILEDAENGSEWLIGKGKRIVVTYPRFTGDYMGYLISGPLVTFTDSTLTIYDAITERNRIIPLENIGEIKVNQSSLGKGTGGFFLGTGGLLIIMSPFAGKQEHRLFSPLKPMIPIQG